MKTALNLEEMNGKIKLLESEIAHLNLKLSEQEKLKEQLMQAQRKEVLASLSGGIAHDFNNILQSILGYTQLALLQKAPADPDYKTFAEIETLVNKGSELARQFLKIGRKICPKLAPLNINQTILETQKLLKRTFPKMIHMELNMAEDLKLINADEGQIEQILMNLMINARDAMSEKGRLIVSTQNVTDPDQLPVTQHRKRAKEYILLSVEDTGCGMSPETLEQVFRPFYTTKGNHNGNGLGLSMVEAIMRNHGGLIDCWSKLNVGTIFRLYFPVLNQQQKTPNTGTEKARFHQRGKETILLVDDEKKILSLLQAMLEKFGYHVITAHSGEEAIQEYACNAVDAVILDVGMPGMGGIKCLKQLLKMDQTATVLMSSGYNQENHIQDTLRLGAKDFIYKPYNISQLLKTLRNIIDQRGGISKLSINEG